jgi:hypothetical protein
VVVMVRRNIWIDVGVGYVREDEEKWTLKGMGGSYSRRSGCEGPPRW